MKHRWLLILIWCACGTSPSAAEGPEAGRAVFVTTGEHGEPSFSDVEEPGAERITVPVPQPAEDPAEIERRIAQTLAVAEALETSRLARERARAEARAELRAQEREEPPDAAEEERYVGVYPYPYPFRPPWRSDRFPHRDRFPGSRDHDRRPPSDRDEAPSRSRTLVWRDDESER